MVHPVKSEFRPKKKLVFLGIELDSVALRVSLTVEKEEKFIRAASELLQKQTPSIREVAGLIGLMIAYSQAFTYGSVHLKELETEKVEALRASKGDFDSKMGLSAKAQDNIHWWLQNVRESGKVIRPGDPVVGPKAKLIWL